MCDLGFRGPFLERTENIPGQQSHFQSSVSKNSGVYTLEISSMKGTSCFVNKTILDL